MGKIAVINITSFGREFPEFVEELEAKVGKVEKFILPADIPVEELIDLLKGYQYVLLGNYPYFGETFFKQCDLKLIARHGIGFNNIDLKSAKEHNIYVTSIPNEIEMYAVAEQALALTLSISKNVVVADDMVHQGEWNVNRQRIMGIQLTNKVTGIIGYGNIGSCYAKMMQHGLNNEVLVYDPYLSKEVADKDGVTLVELDELLAKSDVVSLHANLTKETTHILNEKNLSKMKTSAILINSDRGDLIYEKALIKVLKEKKIFGYGADVASVEPMLKENELLTLPNVIITPHSSIYNTDCMWQMNRKVVDDVCLVEVGSKPNNIINDM